MKDFTREQIALTVLVYQYPGGPIESLPEGVQEWCEHNNAVYMPAHPMEKQAWLTAQKVFPEIERMVPDSLFWSSSYGSERCYAGNYIVITPLGVDTVLSQQDLDEGL